MTAAVWQALADAVLVVHAAFVAFVVFGLVLIPVGHRRGWDVVNGLPFRLLHVVAIIVVALESWFGVDCPLTVLENELRLRGGAAAYQSSFIEHWIGGLIFHDAPPVVFTLLYSAFAALVVACWWCFPPRRR